MRHHDPSLPVEDKVAGGGQLFQPPADRGNVSTELAGEFSWCRRTPGLGERPVHRQPQILPVHPTMLPGSTGSGCSDLTIHGYALSSHVGLAWASP